MLVGKPRGKAILVAKECLGFAIDLCHFDEKYRDAFFYVFGDTLVVQTLDEARKWMGGVRLVTIEGELIEASGAMIGGDMERSTVKFGQGVASEMEKIAEKLREAQADGASVAIRLDELRKGILDLEGEIKESGGRSGAVEVKTSTLEAKRKDFAAKVATADKDLKDRKERFDEAQKTATRIEEDLTKFTKALEALKGKRDERKKAVIAATPQQISSRMKELMSRRATLAEELSGLRSKLEAMATQTAFLEERRTEVGARLTTLDGQRKDHEKRINAFQESLGHLETEIRGLEDYDAQQARAVELKDEFKRLEGQREELIHLVDELTDKKKEGLAKIFTSINENFSRVYAELTEGGEAELALENPEKPFEAGLLLKVKPAHKKALRLEALSGGERSLASMALIFAIQEYDPSPFYLLDEIDQNLDAVNAEKVARMIRRNSATAQFVQISLRKVSLKEADHLVGVTMTPDSLSEVIMRVNLAEIEDEKPTEVIPA